jgi:hypothetical protein
MAEVGCDDGTNMDFSATKNAHEIQKNCMFQNMLAILCGWAWNEKLQEKAMEHVANPLKISGRTTR